MTQGIDPGLADRIEFHVNHEKWRIDSTDPDIFLRDRGYTPDPGMHYFTLHWGGREIPTAVDERKHSVGKNAHRQWIWEVRWKVMSIGRHDYASKGAASAFKFKSQEEFIC